jgi:hypothetical protein
LRVFYNDTTAAVAAVLLRMFEVLLNFSAGGSTSRRLLLAHFERARVSAIIADAFKKMAAHLRDGQLSGVLERFSQKLIVVNFGNASSPVCASLEDWFDLLPMIYPESCFCGIERDECPSDAQTYQITEIPTFLFFLNQKEVARVVSGDSEEIEALVRFFTPPSASEDASEDASEGEPDSPEVLEVRAKLGAVGFSAEEIDAALQATNFGDFTECMNYVFNQMVASGALRVRVTPVSGPEDTEPSDD